ncbi:MAG: protein translocase SEC61 complex subunit gamma [Sulfolobales archaeon]|jgi:protein transport protein SEC61 subunit gamma-like protein
MNISEIIESWRKIIELARKPDPEEYKLFLRIIFLGFFLVGAIGFAIGMISYLILTYLGGGGGT